MQLDYDLIRTIMLNLETEHIGGTQMLFDSNVDGYTPNEVIGHYHHLIDRGFIEAEVTGSGSLNLKAQGILPDGHDFLEAVRDEQIWNKTKKGALQAGGGTLEILKDLAKGYLKKKVEDTTGIKL